MITSLLDNDLYKFTMMNAVLKKAPDTEVTYKFYNRGGHEFNDQMENELVDEIDALCRVGITRDELEWLQNTCPFFDKTFIEYLRGFRLNTDQVGVWHSSKDGLQISIKGNWAETILWEVPLMAMISELYYKYCDTDWIMDERSLELFWANDFRLQVATKSVILDQCKYADFGTRRRRSYEVQDRLVSELKNTNSITHMKDGFVGTSNVHFAMKYGLKPIGTMAHEWIMGMSVLEGLRHANRFAMEAWNDVYDGRLGIALTDTYGSDAFFADCNGTLARTFDGVRHDSGCPYKFTMKVIKFYRDMGINPQSKTIVFSDGLDADKAFYLNAHCSMEGINCSFGIGTNFTNDFKDSPAMNMVIKLDTVNGVPVVKLSDEPGKVTGDPEAVNVARWTFGIRQPNMFTTGDIKATVNAGEYNV